MVEWDVDLEAVKAAKMEEIEFMRKIGVFEMASREECVEKTGHQPVSTKWVVVYKGKEGNSDVRCRLVARDFKPKGEKDRIDLFAAMPPWEAKKLLFRMGATMMNSTSRGGSNDDEYVLIFVDVKKAHLNGKLEEDEWAYVELPEEAGGGVGRLRRWLYGMRPAASAWERDYTENLTVEG